MLYSIFIPSPTGDLIKASPGASASTGYAPWSNVPLGNPFTDAFRGQRAPSKGELIQQLVGTAYACADLNAGAVAANPFRLMVRTGGAKGGKVRFWRTRSIGRRKALKLRAAGYDVADGEVEEVVPDPTDPTRTHPLLQLLARPTRDPNGIASYDLRYCTQLYLESLGTAYWWIPRNRLGTPDQIWLLRGHMVREVPDYEGSQLIAYYLYGRQEIPADEIIKFSVPDPYTLYYGGYSPLLAAIDKIRISRKEDAHVSALLDNMGRPDAMLIPKGGAEGEGIGAEEARRWRAMMQAEFRRAGRGGLAVSEFPGSLEVLGWKPQDIVEIERATAIKTDICNCFGVPDALLERNASNLASAKTADYSHAKYAVNPRCVRMSETLNEKLVKLFDPTGSLFLVYDNPIPDDEVFELEVTKTGAQQGVATVNESRAAIGLDPIDGPAGDMRYMANTLAPVGDDGKLILPPPPEKPPAPLAKPKKKDQTARIVKEITREFSRTMRAVVREINKEKEHGGGNADLRVAGAADAGVHGDGGNRVQRRDEQAAESILGSSLEQDGAGIADGGDEQGSGRTGRARAAGPATGTPAATHEDQRAESAAAARSAAPAPTLGALPPLREGSVAHAPDGTDVRSESDTGVVPTPREEDREGRRAMGEKAAGPIGNRDPNTGLAGPLSQGDELLHVLRGLFHEQAKAILDELHTKDAADEVATKAFWEGKGRFGLPDRFRGLGEWVGKMADAVTTYLEAYIVTGGRTLIQRIGVSLGFDRVVNPEVTEAAKRLALKFSESTNETTTMQLDQALDALREELAEGLEAGDGRVELRKRVQEVFDKADAERAETIARTEASRATHEGELIAARKSGVVKRKSWLASADACDECEALSVASAEGIELDTPFTITKYGAVDGPPLHPNCACSQTMILKDAEEITATAAGDEEGAAKAISRKADDGGDGHWVTINGTHVLIRDGVIARGPSSMIGKKPDELGDSHKPLKKVGAGEGSYNHATGGMSEAEAEAHYENREVPDGWFIHGRAERHDLNTGNPLQLTLDADTAEQYAGKRGSVWYMKPTKDAKVTDMTDSAERERVAALLWKDYEKGGAPPDFDAYVEREGEDKAKAQLSAELNPKDIVDSAGFYDNTSYTTWLYDKTGIDWAMTNDGAVVLNADESATHSVRAWKGSKKS